MSAYLDNHAATKPCQSAIDQMMPYLKEMWASSFSPHQKGREQWLALEGRKEFVMDLAGASSQDLCYFTSSGREAVQQVLWSVYVDVSRKQGKGHFLTASCEDSSVLLGLKRLEDLGCSVRAVSYTPQGTLNLDELKEFINPRTALFTISLASPLSGVIQPIEEIADICRERGVLFHIDATYAVGKYPITFISDYLSFSGSCMHALKSSGVLFAKPKVPFISLIVGEGSLDVPSIIAMSAASQQALLGLDAMEMEIARLRSRLEEGILEKIPQSEVLFTNSLRLPNVAAFFFPKVHQEALLYRLDAKQVYASMGGACHSLLSSVCRAAGYSEEIALSSLSFALSRFTEEEEIERAIDAITGSYQQLYQISGAL